MLFDPPVRLTLVIAAIVAAALVAVGLYWRGERVAARRSRVVLACLRTVVVLAVGFLLLNPVAVRSSAGSKGKARFFVLLDTSRSMAVKDIGGGSRFAAAQEAILGERGTAERLSSRWEVSCFGFDARARRRAEEELRSMEKPNGDRTELGEALTTVASEANRRGERTAGVLLVSDGRDNGETPPLAAARLARTAGLPTWTLCLGTGSGTKDVSVLTYASQSFAFAKQQTNLGAEIRQQGYGATTVTVTLERDDQPTTSQTVSFADDGRQTVRFPVTEEHPGLFKYTINVAPLAGEINRRNNSRSVFLRVINEKVKVLLLDARPSWDTKFLSQTLRQDRNIELTSIYRFARSRDYAVTADTKAASAKIKLPRRFDELAPYEVVIIGKGFEDLLTEQGVDLLKEYLLKRSGSVVFFRGKADEGTEQLRDLEPVVWSGDELRDLELSLTEEGRHSPAFTFPTPEEPQTVVRELPHLISATRVESSKSFAVVLARAAASQTAEEPMASVAFQRYGNGRVMVIAGQGLWRWGFLPDGLANKYEGVYSAFWRQMIRWLVSGSDFLPGQEFSLKTDRLTYTPGQKVNLLIYAKRKLRRNQTVALEVIDPDGQRLPITPSRSDAFGATLVGAYTPKEVGDYSVALRTGPREADRLEAAFIVIPGQQEDMVTAADPQLMRQIAEVSGGKPLALDELGDLPKQLREAEKRTLLREEKTPLWDRPWVLAALCMLLSVEWYLRRRGGLC